MNEQTFSAVQMPLTLKAKDLFMIAYFLKFGQAAIMFPLLHKIKTAVNDQTQLDDDVQVSATIDQITTTMSLLGGQPEVFMADTNRSVKQSLKLQLEALVHSTDEGVSGAAQCTLDLIGSIAADNAAKVNAWMNEGKNFILYI